MAHKKPTPGRRESGHAVIEVALMAPWIFFLFVGVLDFGFFAYAAIATENAARVAALYTSNSPDVAGDDLNACQYALGELRALPNVGSTVTTCVVSKDSITSTQPVAVDATAIAAVDSVDGAPASRAEVTYQSLPMIPIPGLMMKQYTLTRFVEMRVRED